MAQQTLPASFADLEPFVGWALPTERERTSKRLASSMEELQSFYDTLLPRMETIVEYLNRFPLDAMPEDAQRLFYMSLSLMEVADAVELFQNPAVINGFDVKRFVPAEDI